MMGTVFASGLTESDDCLKSESQKWIWSMVQILVGFI